MLNVTNIPAARVPFVDSDTGLITREWYRFFYNIFLLSGGGTNQTTLNDFQVGPPASDIISVVADATANVGPPAQDTTAIIANATADVGPPAQDTTAIIANATANITPDYQYQIQAFMLDIQSLALQPTVQVGTLAYQNNNDVNIIGGSITAITNLLVGSTTAPISGTNVGITSSSGAGLGLVSYANSGAPTKKWSEGPDSNGNFFVFNDASAGMYMVYGGTSWTSSSDERVKADLVPIENAASKVSSLRAVTGRFKTDKAGTSRAFLLAQDVQAIFPEAVDASNPESLGLQYADMIPLLVAAIKELEARLAALEAK
jgi:hypothetical protein